MALKVWDLNSNLEHDQASARFERDWPNFIPVEVACKCCNKVMVDEFTMDALQRVRNTLQRPLTITSGFRCIKHNEAVGGATNSRHIWGMAFDIPATKLEQMQIMVAALKHGFKGFGAYESFIHIDTGTARVWVG